MAQPAADAIWSSFALVRPVEAGVAMQQQLWIEAFADGLRPNMDGLPALFEALAKSEAFKQLWAGRRRGPFLLPRFGCIEAILELDEISEGLAAASRAGEMIPAAISLLVPGMQEMHINSQLPPVTSRADLEELMRFGTVFFNAASKHWRSLARICQEASAAFAFPANINLYTTSPGRAVSTPPHADHHDVLIMQSQGSKRWRVFAPPHSRPGRHPLYRGKGEDSLCEAELGPALIDVILRPGECLFVPSGFPHATSTAIAERAAASVHLTLGLAAADCGLTYQTLAGQVLLEMGFEPPEDEELAEDVFWTLNRPLPLGCLSSGGGKAEIVQHLAAELRGMVSKLWPTAYLRKRDPSEEVLETLGLEDAVSLVASRWYDIWADLLQIHWDGYENVIRAKAGGRIVATGLVGTSVFHALPGPCDEGLVANAEDEGEMDPSILSAISSTTKFCDFIRARIPSLELKWQDAVTVTPKDSGPKVGVLPAEFELVD